MTHFLAKFLNKNHPIKARVIAISFCLIHRYYFPHLMEDGMGDLRIFDVVTQMEIDRDHSALVLDETIMGLDRRATLVRWRCLVPLNLA